jgi:hypothetical protein
MKAALSTDSSDEEMDVQVDLQLLSSTQKELQEIRATQQGLAAAIKTILDRLGSPSSGTANAALAQAPDPVSCQSPSAPLATTATDDHDTAGATVAGVTASQSPLANPPPGGQGSEIDVLTNATVPDSKSPHRTYAQVAGSLSPKSAPPPLVNKRGSLTPVRTPTTRTSSLASLQLNARPSASDPPPPPDAPPAVLPSGSATSQAEEAKKKVAQVSQALAESSKLKWAALKEKVMKDSYLGGAHWLHAARDCKCGPIDADTDVTIIATHKTGTFSVERLGLSNDAKKHAIIAFKNAHFMPISTGGTTNEKGEFIPNSGWLSCFPTHAAPLQMDGLEWALSDPAIGAAVVACLKKWSPTMTVEGQQLAATTIEVLAADPPLEMTVGEINVVGPCFFATIEALFPQWPVVKQKTSLVQAAESDGPTLAKVVRELQLAESALSLADYHCRSRQLRKAARSVKTASASKPKPKPKQAVVTVLVSSSEDEADEDYIPAKQGPSKKRNPSHQRHHRKGRNQSAEPESDSESVSSSKSPRQHKPIQKRTARRRSSRQSRQSRSRRDQDTSGSKSGASDSEGKAPKRRPAKSLVWGVARRKWKSIEAMAQFLKGFGAKLASLPLPASLHVANEQRKGNFHYVVCHDTLEDAAKWRAAVVKLAIPGVRVAKWMPLHERLQRAEPLSDDSVSPVRDRKANSGAAASERTSSPPPPSRRPNPRTATDLLIASIKDAVVQAIRAALPPPTSDGRPAQSGALSTSPCSQSHSLCRQPPCLHWH